MLGLQQSDAPHAFIANHSTWSPLAAGAVEPLSRLAGSSDAKLQALAVAALGCLASGGDDELCDAILAAGALPVLVRLLHSGSAATAQAVGVLAGLTEGAGDDERRRQRSRQWPALARSRRWCSS